MRRIHHQVRANLNNCPRFFFWKKGERKEGRVRRGERRDTVLQMCKVLQLPRVVLVYRV